MTRRTGSDQRNPVGAGGGEGMTDLACLLTDLKEKYAERRPRSQALFDRATASLPGGNSRTQLYFAPFPAYAVRGEGPRVWDLDGFEYLDLINNYTSLIHGHPTPATIARLQERMTAGTSFGAPTPLEVELGEVLCERIPSVERVRFTNSGTEACLYALRAARAYTGRDAIIKAEGGYHGGSEFLQVSVKHLGFPGESVPEAGVPAEAARGTHTIPWNDAEAAVETVRRLGDRAAALIVEPMQGSAGQLPPEPGFLRALRDVTAETGCLLVFDEVMTLRLSYGGAQERYGITPDLTTMGKIIGGGFPIGAFGGRAEIMEILDPRRTDAMGHHGTFNANPVALAAGLRALEDLPRARVDELNERGDRLRAHINGRAAAHGLPLVATGDGSLVQVHVGATPPRSFREASERPRLPLEYLFFALLDRGTYIAPRGLICLSTALGNAELQRVEGALDEALEELAGTGPATWGEEGRSIEDTEGGR